MNHTLSDSQLEEMIKSAVNSFGPLPPDEKFSLLISALRELQERRKAAMDSKPVAWLLSGGGAKNVVCFDSGNAYADPLREVTPLYAVPRLEPASVEPVAYMYDGEDGREYNGHNEFSGGGKGIPLYRHAQPASERDQVRIAHAEWSQETFGNVGPVGPLKHLSKEALEAAAEPDDLSEWADMQFLLWDAQRRAGITDEQITQAMIEKLAVNKQRSWPEPKDGEPRLHIKEQQAPVVPEDVRQALSQMDDEIIAELDAEESACRAAMRQGKADGTLMNEGTIPATQIKPVADLYGILVPGGRTTTYSTDAAEASDCRVMGWSVQEYVKLESYQSAMLAAAPQEAINALIPLVSRNEQEVK